MSASAEHTVWYIGYRFYDFHPTIYPFYPTVITYSFECLHKIGLWYFSGFDPNCAVSLIILSIDY